MEMIAHESKMANVTRERNRENLTKTAWWNECYSDEQNQVQENNSKFNHSIFAYRYTSVETETWVKEKHKKA